MKTGTILSGSFCIIMFYNIRLSFTLTGDDHKQLTLINVLLTLLYIIHANHTGFSCRLPENSLCYWDTGMFSQIYRISKRTSLILLSWHDLNSPKKEICVCAISRNFHSQKFLVCGIYDARRGLTKYFSFIPNIYHAFGLCCACFMPMSST